MATDEGPSPKLAPSKGGKYRKLATNVIRTRPLQSPSDDFNFVVISSCRPLSTSHRSAR